MMQATDEEEDDLDQLLDDELTPPPAATQKPTSTNRRRGVSEAAGDDAAYAFGKPNSGTKGRNDTEPWEDPACAVWYTRCVKLNTVCLLVHLSSAIVTLVLAIRYSSFSQSLFLESVGSLREPRFTAEGSAAPLYLVPAYFACSAIAHTVLHIMRDKTWKRWLMQHKNPLRWIEYSFSASIMIVCISILSGLVTYTGLMQVFVNSFMSIVMGWVMETMNPFTATNRRTLTWTPFLLGCIPALTTWAAAGVPFWASVSHIPGWVIAIYISVFLTFNAFPFIMVYQYRGVRSQLKYVKGECAYMIASVVAKSVLGWQVVGGTLRA